MAYRISQHEYERALTASSLGPATREAARRILVLGQGPTAAADGLGISKQAASGAARRLVKAYQRIFGCPPPEHNPAADEYAQPQNLIDTYFFARLSDDPRLAVGTLYRELSDLTGYNLDSYRIYRMRKGTRSVPAVLQKELLRHAVPYVLGELGCSASDDQVNRACSMLSPPPRT